MVYRSQSVILSTISFFIYFLKFVKPVILYKNYDFMIFLCFLESNVCHNFDKFVYEEIYLCDMIKNDYNWLT